MGPAIALVARRWLQDTEPRVLSHVTSFEIPGGRSGSVASLSLSFFVPPPPGYRHSMNVHPSPPPEVWHSPGHAAHYHIVTCMGDYRQGLG
jgi:hypothetical protein